MNLRLDSRLEIAEPMTDEPTSPSSLSVVVPVYHSEGTLAALVARLEPVLERLAPGEYEVLLVNDGSRDGSWEVIERLAAERTWLTGINLMRNYGQHNALLAGVRAARGEVIVTLDDDLQHPPEELPKLLAKLNEGYDVVYGTTAEGRHGMLRNAASRFTKLSLQAAMGAETADKVSAFRAFRTLLRRGFTEYTGMFVSLDVLLTWSTTRFAAVAVRHEERSIGVSNYTLAKLFTHAMNMLTGFSTLPLQLASLVGFSFTLFGFGVLLFVLGRYVLEGGSVPGFPFLASLITILSGAQLFGLGIIGEYLARMHFRAMKKPAYVVRGTSTAPASNGRTALARGVAMRTEAANGVGHG